MLSLGTKLYVEGKVVGMEINRDGDLEYKIDVVNHDGWDRPERITLKEDELGTFTKDIQK